MRVLIDSDEWYPVYSIRKARKVDETGYTKKYIREVPDDVLVRYEKCMEVFNEIQDELERYDKNV